MRNCATSRRFTAVESLFEESYIEFCQKRFQVFDVYRCYHFILVLELDNVTKELKHDVTTPLQNGFGSNTLQRVINKYVNLHILKKTPNSNNQQTIIVLFQIDGVTDHIGKILHKQNFNVWGKSLIVLHR